MVASTRAIFKRRGSILPTAIILKADKSSIILSTEFKGDTDKFIFDKRIKEACKNADVIAVLFFSEAWTKAINKGEESEYLNPNGSVKAPIRDMYGKKECIIFNFETKLFAQSSFIEIIREGDTVTLMEEKTGGTGSGRFHDLLVMPLNKN